MSGQLETTLVNLCIAGGVALQGGLHCRWCVIAGGLHCRWCGIAVGGPFKVLQNCRWCGIAGAERMLPSLLDWYRSPSQDYLCASHAILLFNSLCGFAIFCPWYCIVDKPKHSS